MKTITHTEIETLPDGTEVITGTMSETYREWQEIFWEGLAAFWIGINLTLWSPLLTIYFMIESLLKPITFSREIKKGRWKTPPTIRYDVKYNDDWEQV